MTGKACLASRATHARRPCGTRLMPRPYAPHSPYGFSSCQKKNPRHASHQVSAREMTNSGTFQPTAASTGTTGNSVGSPIPIAKAAVAHLRPFPLIGDEVSQIGSRGNAQYNGLVLELRSSFRKLGHGFGASYRMAYTLSKTMDDGLNNTANAEIDGDFSREWARSLQDRRHRLAFSGTF